MAVAMTMAVAMRMSVGFDRHEHDMTMPHAAFGDHMIRERFDLTAAALQHRHFKTRIVIEMDVQGGLREVVMFVKILGQAFRQFARGVDVDIA